MEGTLSKQILIELSEEQREYILVALGKLAYQCNNGEDEHSFDPKGVDELYHKFTKLFKKHECD